MSCARSTVQCFSSLLWDLARLGLQDFVTVKATLFCPRSTILEQLVSAAAMHSDPGTLSTAQQSDMHSTCNAMQVPFCYSRAREHLSILLVTIKSCSVNWVHEAVSLANLMYCTQSI